MTLRLQIIMILVTLVLFALFVYFLRKRVMRLKYCLLWLFSILIVIILCAFPNLLTLLSNLFGIHNEMYALFIMCIAFLTGICISLTVVVSRLSDKLLRLIQAVAIEEAAKKYIDKKGVDDNE